jgi:hypothetical protein
LTPGIIFEMRAAPSSPHAPAGQHRKVGVVFALIAAAAFGGFAATALHDGLRVPAQAADTAAAVPAAAAPRNCLRVKVGFIIAPPGI